MIATSLLRGIPGSFIKFLKEYDDKYDPEAQAIVSFDVLHELIHKFIIDVVSQTSHPRFGLSRAEVWKRAIAEFPPALPKSNQELKILIGEVDHRVVGPHGVEFDGLFYKNPDELTRLRHMYEPSASSGDLFCERG
jgi:putative transposase